MKDRLEENELFRASHLMILKSYTIFSVVLLFEALILGWEKWALILVMLSLVMSWALHIEQKFSELSRLWIYSFLMMATYFFYGIHLTSTFDLAIVMSAVIFLYIMTGIKSLVTLCQLTFYFTFLFDIAAMISVGEHFDSLMITRSLLHLGMVTMEGWTGRTIINRWGDVMLRSHGEIEELRNATVRLNDFLANVSHEIRTPINAIMGLSKVILEKEKNPEILSDMKAINEAGKMVDDQMTEILDYSEIDRKKLVNNFENYSLSSLIDDLIKDLGSHLDPGKEIIFDVDPSIPLVLYSDEEKIKKILKQLILNGIKYTNQGGVYVHITAVKREYGVNLCIEVTDTGIGMDNEQMEHIYDGFYQGDSSRTRTVSGLGLGMSIVSGFVSSLGGFITLDSARGKGTTVRISIPQTVVDDTPCMTLKDRENLCLGAYVRLNKFADPAVRKQYNTIIMNIVSSLGITIHRVDEAQKLKKLSEAIKLTHVFVGQQEYEEDSRYLEELSGSVLVFVVAENGYKLPETSKAILLQKPFCSFSVVNALNMTATEREHSKKRMVLKKVYALVVDDEPMNLTVAQGILGMYGMKVDTAISGFEAIQLCKKNDYDVVFMDHMMPEMDGVAAMKKIKATRTKAEKTLRFIVLTANTVSTAREMFVEEGFDGFVSKPIDQTDLERTIKRVIPASLIEFEEVTDRKEEAKAEVPQTEIPSGEEPTVTVDSLGDEIFTFEPQDLSDSDKVAEELTEGQGEQIDIDGINAQTGLSYCRDDIGFYKTLLLQYASEAPDKKEKLGKALDDKDAKNFEILVHALKSTSKMIGAMEISETARMMELDAEKGKLPTDEQFLSLMKQYEGVVDQILKKIEPEEEPDQPEDEEEIFEFEPEGSDDDKTTGGTGL